jgi:polysaccharide chain length determinant protein (PEP-CTERM system associated)
MRPLTPEDYIEIWSRRKWWFFGAAFLIAAGTAIVAALLPKMYTSECLILLEGQPLASEANAAAQRPGGDPQTEQQIQTLIQQALSRTRLEKILQDAGYTSPSEPPSESALDELRSHIDITILKDNDPRRASGPFGFKVSYKDHIPKNAQRITNELASFIVSERLKSQEETAQESNQYLESQLDTALKDLTEKQQALADFKQRYNGELPLDEQLNVQSLVRLQTQLQVNQQAVERAHEEITAIESTSQATTGASKQAAADSETAKLKSDLGALKAKLADLLSRDTPSHPDVIKTRAEIAHVESELANEQQPEAKSSDTETKQAATNVPASNQNRLNDAKAQIVALLAEQKRIQEGIEHYQGNLQQTPLHAQQYAELERAYQESKTNYDALKKKVDDAHLTNDMKVSLQGQRFRIQDFASLPTEPTTPVYWKINLGGLGAALLLGVVLAGAIEFRDTTMKSDRDIEYYLQTKNLATVPVLSLPVECKRASMRKILWVMGTVPTILVTSGLLGYLYFIRK